MQIPLFRQIIIKKLRRSNRIFSVAPPEFLVFCFELFNENFQVRLLSPSCLPSAVYVITSQSEAYAQDQICFPQADAKRQQDSQQEQVFRSQDAEPCTKDRMQGKPRGKFQLFHVAACRISGFRDSCQGEKRDRSMILPISPGFISRTYRRQMISRSVSLSSLTAWLKATDVAASSVSSAAGMNDSAALRRASELLEFCRM